MLNAVCVPADLQYVAKIRCDQDDVHSSWAAATAASSTNTPPTHPHKHGLEEDSGGGDHCCCNSPRSTASGAENMGNNKLGLANADSNCNSLYIDKQQDRTMHHTNIPYLLPLNAGQFQYQNTYQQNCCDIGFHSQTFPIPQEPSSMPLSSQSGCELPGLDSNSGFYTGSISCYASSSSESSGDSSSPGYDASTFCTFESVLANLDISNLDNPQTQSQNDSFLSMLGSSSVKNLKDLTNTFNVKREVVQCPTACSYVTATESTWESAKEPHLSSQNAVASSYQENAGINPNSFDANLDEFASQTYPFLDGGDEMQVVSQKTVVFSLYYQVGRG